MVISRWIPICSFFFSLAFFFCSINLPPTLDPRGLAKKIYSDTYLYQVKRKTIPIMVISRWIPICSFFFSLAFFFCSFNLPPTLDPRGLAKKIYSDTYLYQVKRKTIPITPINPCFDSYLFFFRVRVWWLHLEIRVWSHIPKLRV